MSTQTNARKLSMPNTGKILSAINVKTDTSSKTINAKYGHNLVSYLCQQSTQTDARKLLMPNIDKIWSAINVNTDTTS